MHITTEAILIFFTQTFIFYGIISNGYRKVAAIHYFIGLGRMSAVYGYHPKVYGHHPKVFSLLQTGDDEDPTVKLFKYKVNGPGEASCL